MEQLIRDVKSQLAQLEAKEGRPARDRIVRNTVNESKPETRTVDRASLYAQLKCDGMGPSAARELWFYVMCWLVENGAFHDAIDWEAD